MNTPAPSLYTTTFDTPCGPFSVAVNPTGALVATAFGDLAALQLRLPADICHIRHDKDGLTDVVKNEVSAYFLGKLCVFTLPTAARGTTFQKRIWAALVRIPFGETRSYGQVAAAIGKPGAARAIGRANATNPICLIVPCHRVIGADGSLTGFAAGEDIKRQLLAHEGVILAEEPAGRR